MWEQQCLPVLGQMVAMDHRLFQYLYKVTITNVQTEMHCRQLYLSGIPRPPDMQFFFHSHIMMSYDFWQMLLLTVIVSLTSLTLLSRELEKKNEYHRLNTIAPFYI